MSNNVRCSKNKHGPLRLKDSTWYSCMNDEGAAIVFQFFFLLCSSFFCVLVFIAACASKDGSFCYTQPSILTLSLTLSHSVHVYRARHAHKTPSIYPSKLTHEVLPVREIHPHGSDGVDNLGGFLRLPRRESMSTRSIRPFIWSVGPHSIICAPTRVLALSTHGGVSSEGYRSRGVWRGV